jgi:hypothetical protein
MVHNAQETLIPTMKKSGADNDDDVEYLSLSHTIALLASLNDSSLEAI